jgi:catechol 2,3-dioxygenase-like lactoylglutathione lyase family enzyme
MCRRVFAVLLALALAAPVAAPAGAHGARSYVSSVGPIAMTVANADRSAAFYSDMLGFEKLSDTEVGGEPWARLYGVAKPRLRVVQMRLGDERIELLEFLTPRGRPIPADSRSQDRWFQHVAIIVSDMDRAYARLQGAGVIHVSPSPQRLPDWNPKAGGIRAFYFKDPDGHVLEILWFPPGKGATKWRRTDALFLGIDHTAIVVADTARSLRCYRDTLGLVVAGESENWGPEQERLNNVVGARLRITTLRAPEGPGIEMLEYLSPRDGRPGSDETGANDLVHWHTGLVTPDVAGLERALRDGVCGAAAAPTVIVPAGHDSGFTRAFLTRDPDAHALQVMQP